MSSSATVPGFRPSLSGFHFGNYWPPGTEYPVVTLPIVGSYHQDANSGLCGGFVFTVLDLFLNNPRFGPPPDQAPPAGGTLLFNYLTRRSIDSFGSPPDFDNAAKMIQWVQTPTRDVAIDIFDGPGLSRRIVYEEWPAIKADIDVGRPSPLTLVMNPQCGFGDVPGIIGALHHCHQVLAYAYSLDDSNNLTLSVYDPDDPNDDGSTISCKLSDPHATIDIIAHAIGKTLSEVHAVRGFFRSDYSFTSPFTEILTGFGNISSHPFWIGDFIGSWHSQVLFYSPGDGHWWLGSYTNGQLQWSLISQTRNPAGIDFADTSKFPTWIGDFSGSGHSQVLFYSSGDGHWWLGSYANGQLHWTVISQTRNPAGIDFGDTSRFPTWIGDFSGSGHSQVLFYSSGDGHWWLGSYANGQLHWSVISQTRNPNGLNFGDTSQSPTWIGDFSGSGHSQVLFYSSHDGHWWLGSYADGQLKWSLISQTRNPAGINFADTSRLPTWIGDFRGSGHSQVLFYSPGDGHWWLGSYANEQLQWSLISQTRNPNGLDFGDTSKSPTWIGDLSGSGHSQVLFYSPGDDNWWLGSYSGNQLNWSKVGNTSGFGHDIHDGRPFWVGDFCAIGQDQSMFYFPSDGNWWLGTVQGTTLTWVLAGNTGALVIAPIGVRL
jgi:hypothetical protein